MPRETQVCLSTTLSRFALSPQCCHLHTQWSIDTLSHYDICIKYDHPTTCKPTMWPLSNSIKYSKCCLMRLWGILCFWWLGERANHHRWSLPNYIGPVLNIISHWVGTYSVCVNELAKLKKIVQSGRHWLAPCWPKVRPLDRDEMKFFQPPGHQEGIHFSISHLTRN